MIDLNQAKSQLEEVDKTEKDVLDRVGFLLEERDCIDKEIEELETFCYVHLSDVERSARGDLYRALSASGLSDREIASQEGYSVATIKNYRRYNKSVPVSESTRMAVWKRDNFACSLCKSKKRLHTHHIDSPLNDSLENLVTLCASCHKNTHMERGATI